MLGASIACTESTNSTATPSSSPPLGSTGTATCWTVTITPTATPTYVLPIPDAVPLYQQCGGEGYTGQSVCVPGAYCYEYSQWYSQCLPVVATSTGTTQPPHTAVVCT
ncbi:hypothetical protein AB1N83_001917 [Pleurotus pulmonarius]